MESRAKLLGHPIHPMLIVFPLGLLATAVAFDIVSLASGADEWFRISFWMIAADIKASDCGKRHCHGPVHYQLVSPSARTGESTADRVCALLHCRRAGTRNWLARGRAGR